MIANAGIWHPQAIQEGVFASEILFFTLAMSTLRVVDEEEWDLMMSINLRATMLCFKYAAQEMIKQGRGGVIIGLYRSSFIFSRMAIITACL